MKRDDLSINAFIDFTKRDLGAADAISMNNGASSALSSSAKSADGGSNGGGGGGMGSSNGGGSGGNDYLECVCVAWSRSNNWYEFESDSSIIRQACEYLKLFQFFLKYCHNLGFITQHFLQLFNVILEIDF